MQVSNLRLRPVSRFLRQNKLARYNRHEGWEELQTLYILRMTFSILSIRKEGCWWVQRAMENPFTTPGIELNQIEKLDYFMFGWIDYALFSLLLLVSVLIGVYFAFFSKQDSTTEYLLGGKRMGCFPVAMSIIARSVTLRLSCEK